MGEHQTDVVTRRQELAQQLRVDSIRAADAAGSGHPSSALSAAELMAVLADGHLHLDPKRPDDPNNDQLIFSKGHATPLLYALWKAIGFISDEDLLTYRRFGSPLEGHPAPVLGGVQVATGSLGQGLPIGVGMALTARRLDRLPCHVWVVCGDSEMAEGSMWEAITHAGHAGLDNLTAVIDVNRLGQTRETMLGWDLDTYARRMEAFGWHTLAIEGHDVTAVDRAYREALATRDRPTAVIARTVKGRGASEVEDLEGKHGKPLEDAAAAIDELGGTRRLRIDVAAPRSDAKPHAFETGAAPLPEWELGEKVATREAYGEALAAVGTMRGDVVALDGEVSNSTKSEIFAKAHPDRYFEMFIAEQQMIAAAVGMQTRGWRPFASSFAAFLTRAYDFVRMAAVSRADLCLVGSHAGVSIGPDGPSQMGLEDLAAFRAVHGSTVLHPCDANQTAQLVAAMADLRGISYLRTLRGSTPVVYPPGTTFDVGGSGVLRSSADDAVAVLAVGATVHEALRAAEQLEEEGISARVVDLYSVKPIDVDTISEAVAVTGGRLVTVEDHWPHGGLGDAVAAACSDFDDPPRIIRLGVASLPGSGQPEELRAAAGIDADAIVGAAHRLLGGAR